MAPELDGVFVAALVLVGAPILPALLITIYLGKRVVWSLWLALCLAVIGYLAWYALFGDFLTGMEGMLFLIGPILLVAVGLGALIGSAIGQIFRQG